MERGYNFIYAEVNHLYPPTDSHCHAVLARLPITFFDYPLYLL
ncbi:MAG: hypothetical protein ACE5NP_00130 [Anaerolineae bacterium]